MKPDERDERLAGALDRAAAEVSPSGDERLPWIKRRGTRRRAARFTALATAVAVFVGGVTWSALAIRSHHATAVDTSGWPTRHVLAFTMRVPSSWHFQPFDVVCQNIENHVEIVGGTAWNVPRLGPIPCGGPVAAKFPPRSVMVQISHITVAPPSVYSNQLNDTTFPLPPDEAKDIRIDHGRIEERDWPLVLHRVGYLLSVWIGRDASPDDRSIAAKIVATIRPYQPHQVSPSPIAKPTPPCQPSDAPKPLEGDIDGDGKPDYVTVEWSPAPGNKCAASLFVKFTGRPVVPAVPLGTFDPLGRVPMVLALVNIDTVPGLEIVVDVNEGAATLWIRIFTWRGSRIVRMAVPRSVYSDPLDPNTFAVAGSVGEGIGGVDCVRPGTGEAVYSSSGPLNGNTTPVIRRFLKVVGIRFVLIRTVHGTAPAADPGSKFPELSGEGVFPTCATVRAS